MIEVSEFDVAAYDVNLVRVAKEPPSKRVFTVSATNGKFKIPAGAANHRVDAEFELGSTVTLTQFIGSPQRNARCRIAWFRRRRR